MPTIQLSLREDVSEKSRKASGNFGHFVTTVNQGLELIQRVGGQAYRALDEMFETAGKAEQLRSGFVSLSGGVERADANLAAVQGALRGTVSEMQAMEIANMAMSFGLVDSAEQLGEMTEIGAVLAQSLGQDASKGVADLTLALSRQSPMILDNLGISLKLSDAHEMYAERLGKSVSALTETEKSQAFLNSALEIGRKKVAELGGFVETASTKWQAYKASLEDLKNVSTEEIVDALEPIAELFGSDGEIVEEDTIRGWGALVEGTIRSAIESVESLSESDNRWLQSIGVAMNQVAFSVESVNDEVKDFGKTWELASEVAETVQRGQAAAARQATEELNKQAAATEKAASGYGEIHINSQGVITNLREGSRAAAEFEKEMRGGPLAMDELADSSDRAAVRIGRIDGKIVVTNKALDELADDSVRGFSFMEHAATDAGDAIEDGVGGGAASARDEIERLRNAVIGENTGLIADLSEAFGPDMFSDGDAAFAAWIDREKQELLDRQEEIMGPIGDAVEDGLQDGFDSVEIDRFTGKLEKRVRQSLLDVWHDEELVQAIAEAMGIFTGQGIGDTGDASLGMSMDDLSSSGQRDVQGILRRGAFDAIVSQGLKGAMNAIESGDFLALQRIREGAQNNATMARQRGNSVHNKDFIESNQLLADLVRDLAKTFGIDVPGFAKGGIGDFGVESLARLHGREAIIPLSRGGGEVREAIMGGDFLPALHALAEETRFQTEIVGELLSDVALNTRAAAENSEQGVSALTRYKRERHQRMLEVSRDPTLSSDGMRGSVRRR